MWNRLRRWLHDLPIPDPIEQRQALLVQVILLGLSGVLLFSALLTLVALLFTTGPNAAANLRNSVSNFQGILFLLVPLVLLRRGYFRGAVVILMIELFLLAFNTINARGLEAGWIGALEFALPISLAALTLRRRWLLVTYAASIAAVAATAFARHPLTNISQNPLSATIAFTLIAGLLALFLDRFGTTFRESLTDRMQAAKRLQTQLEQLKLLDQITRAIGERQDLSSIFQVVINSLEDRLPVDFCCICRFDSAARSFIVTTIGAHSRTIAAQVGMAEQSVINSDSKGMSASVVGELVYEPDTKRSDQALAQQLAHGGLLSMVVSPLFVEGEIFGILIAARREGHGFSSPECEFLRQLSEHVALASNQARLYGELQHAYEDLRKTQQAILQQERLRAIGQMASGIAHDINNTISPAALYAELMMEDEAALSPKNRSYLQTIKQAIVDVVETVGRMREFYRQKEPQSEQVPVDLNQEVQQVIQLTHSRWSDMPLKRGVVIEMVTELDPQLPSISGIGSEIREALINVIFNAVDAMPGGGKLTIRTSVRQAVSQLVGEPSSREVVLEAIDTGLGMDENTRQKCLEPFFTTKGEKGTGLGLAMVYGVVQRHGADIEIDSIPGEGTTFRLIFSVPAAVKDKRIETEMKSGTVSALRILIVDDDPLMLESLRNVLETEGHAVTTAGGGQVGIDTFLNAREKGEVFDAVLTDLGMPYVDGRKVADAVKKGSPKTQVILLTGWGQRSNSEGDIPDHVDQILSKPPKLRELRSTLARFHAKGN